MNTLEKKKVFNSLNEVKEFYFPNKELKYLEDSSCDNFSSYINQFVDTNKKDKKDTKKQNNSR